MVWGKRKRISIIFLTPKERTEKDDPEKCLHEEENQQNTKRNPLSRKIRPTIITTLTRGAHWVKWPKARYTGKKISFLSVSNWLWSAQIFLLIFKIKKEKWKMHTSSDRFTKLHLNWSFPRLQSISPHHIPSHSKTKFRAHIFL